MDQDTGIAVMLGIFIMFGCFLVTIRNRNTAITYWIAAHADVTRQKQELMEQHREEIKQLKQTHERESVLRAENSYMQGMSFADPILAQKLADKRRTGQPVTVAEMRVDQIVTLEDPPSAPASAPAFAPAFAPATVPDWRSAQGNAMFATELDQHIARGNAARQHREQTIRAMLVEEATKAVEQRYADVPRTPELLRQIQDEIAQIVTETDALLAEPRQFTGDELFASLATSARQAVFPDAVEEELKRTCAELGIGYTENPPETPANSTSS